MLARAFSPMALEKQGAVCIYAAGVSNSSCTNKMEFDRERKRLSLALAQAANADPFVYFGTCSVADPEVQQTPYVQHKLAMERLVEAHPRHLIFRLPQVAGRTPNPHTLLNFLYARIARSERFTVWKNARRNVIDVDDVARIVLNLISEPARRNSTLNIANPVSYPVTEIVGAMERAVGKPAVYDLVDRGSAYTIDTGESTLAAARAGIIFSDDYLNQVIGKYYGNLE
jgi:nucleoside-diphosphate-sugar epimerase